MRKVVPEKVAVKQDEMSFKMLDGSVIKLEAGWEWINAPGRNNREISACGNGKRVKTSERQYFELPDERIVYRFGEPIEMEEKDESDS